MTTVILCFLYFIRPMMYFYLIKCKLVNSSLFGEDTNKSLERNFLAYPV